MINNLEKIDRVIARIVRDLGLGSEEIPYQDFIEWIADALEHIGAYYQFQEKEATVIVEDYEGTLPCDFYKILAIKQGCKIPADSTVGFYGGSLSLAIYNAFECAGYDCGADIPAYDKYRIINVQGLQGHNAYNDWTDVLSFNKQLFGDVEANKFTSMDYNINFNKITTGYRYGFVTLKYLAIPVDDRGYPMIPDDVSYRDAMFWKVAMQLCMRNPNMFQNPQLQNFDYVKSQWERYCRQARANANMPDLQMLERLKNNWLRMIPDMNPENSEYKNIGKQEYIKLQ